MCLDSVCSGKTILFRWKIPGKASASKGLRSIMVDSWLRLFTGWKNNASWMGRESRVRKFQKRLTRGAEVRSVRMSKSRRMRSRMRRTDRTVWILLLDVIMMIVDIRSRVVGFTRKDMITSFLN